MHFKQNANNAKCLLNHVTHKTINALCFHRSKLSAISTICYLSQVKHCKTSTMLFLNYVKQNTNSNEWLLNHVTHKTSNIFRFNQYKHSAIKGNVSFESS